MTEDVDQAHYTAVTPGTSSLEVILGIALKAENGVTRLLPALVSET